MVHLILLIQGLLTIGVEAALQNHLVKRPTASETGDVPNGDEKVAGFKEGGDPVLIRRSILLPRPQEHRPAKKWKLRVYDLYDGLLGRYLSFRSSMKPRRSSIVG